MLGVELAFAYQLNPEFAAAALYWHALSGLCAEVIERYFGEKMLVSFMPATPAYRVLAPSRAPNWQRGVEVGCQPRPGGTALCA